MSEIGSQKSEYLGAYWLFAVPFRNVKIKFNTFLHLIGDLQDNCVTRNQFTVIFEALFYIYVFVSIFLERWKGRNLSMCNSLWDLLSWVAFLCSIVSPGIWRGPDQNTFSHKDDISDPLPSSMHLLFPWSFHFCFIGCRSQFAGATVYAC